MHIFFLLYRLLHNVLLLITGFPLYRRGENDHYIVPHNKKILLDWGGHANVEFAGGTYCVLYLYKYLFKGAKNVKMRLENADDVDDTDEIGLYIRGRKLCSMDCMWRILGFQTYPATNPSVVVVQARLPHFVDHFRQKKKICDIDVYMNRPRGVEFDNLTFTDFFQKYVTVCAPNSRSAGIPVISIPGISKTIYLSKRLNPENCIVRLAMLYVTTGDIWFLRLILQHKPLHSFADAKTHDRIVYQTYQQSALAMGIIKHSKEAVHCYDDCVTFSTPNELRSTFCMLCIQGFPTLQIFTDVDRRQYMLTDYLQPSEPNVERRNRVALNCLIAELSRRFKFDNKKMSDFGLPEPEILLTELERVRNQYRETEEAQNLAELLLRQPNTVDQDILFREICDSIIAAKDNPELPAKIFFLDASAGTGKTSLAVKLIYFARSIGLIVGGCCSTNLAAQIYGDLAFSTAHSLFCLPVIDNDDKDFDDDIMRCQFEKNPERAELLAATTFFVWDEMPSNNKECFEAVYEGLQHLKGTVSLNMGDFKQQLPVVPGKLLDYKL